jgi:DMSO/TMAO reductase YedYZ molybdopterin-dependent catalytic subunit
MFRSKNSNWWTGLILLLVLVPMVSSCGLSGPDLRPMPSFQYGVPEKDISEYHLVVDGLVVNPLSLSFKSVMKYPTVARTSLLDCPGEFEHTNEWTGVPVMTLLTQAEVMPGANRVTFYALDGYKMWFSLETVERENLFLAYKIDGQLLSRMDGYPIRLVVPEHVGADWVRWVTRIEISDETAPGST